MSHPTLQLKRSYLALRRAIEQAVKPFDVTGAQFDILQFLLHEDGIGHRDLQRRLSIASPTLTKILDGMERENHIFRANDPEDGRVRRIYLAEKARELCVSAAFCQSGDLLVEQMFKGFSLIERSEFLRMLRKLEDNLEKEDETSNTQTK